MTDVLDVMRPHLAAMWADGERLVQRVTKAVTGQVASYAVTPSSEIWIGMTRILERVAHGNPFGEPTEEDRDAAYGTGAQGARAGIRPEDLVAAILLGAAEVEADVMARAAAAGVDADLRLEASTRSRRWAEQVTVWATQSLIASGRGESERQELQDRLVRGLREGMPRSEAHQQAEALGVDPQREWFAVLALPGPAGDPMAATALRLATPGALWASPAEGSAGPELTGLVPQRPRARSDLVIGIAGPTPLASSAATLVDAARAARAAHRFGRYGVHDLTDLGLLVPLHEDPALAERMVSRWIEPLAHEPRHALLATLRSWLAHDGQVDRVAREFGVHPNTVRNRLARIDLALGPDWRTAGPRAEIWTALQAVDAEIVEVSTSPRVPASLNGR